MKPLLLLAACAALLASCTKDKLGVSDDNLLALIAEKARSGDSDYFVMPASGDYAALPNQDPSNPVTEEKVQLGKLLFFETGLAQDANTQEANETFSCATCHVPESGFLPGRIQGIADGAIGFGDQGDGRVTLSAYAESELDAQGVRPLTVMNVTYMTNTLWSGSFGAEDKNIGTEASWTGDTEINHEGFAGIESQNIEGLHLHRMAINDKVLNEYGYAERFDEAFPNTPVAERYTTVTASFAIAAYLRTLLTNTAPFQRYLKGDQDAMFESEKRGAILFFDKANCVSCHSGPSFSSMNFVSLGTKDLYEAGGLNTSADDPRNLGRAFLTGAESDMYRFKVPQLYNLRDYKTFFHGSSKTSIEEVLDYKMTAKSENPNVSDSQVPLRPLLLSDIEKEDLINFLTYGLYDANMLRYVPETVLSGNCLPNNDPKSKADLGCN
ncbi:MAG: cytochrome-c peroxidase [Saprospiraceae bacterium]